MRNFENEPSTESMESYPEYHFKEIAEIEPAVRSLVSQLKEKIDGNEYDTLISDDVGGRIPTLVLRKIIQERNPDQKLGTFFIASGNYLPRRADKEKYEKLQAHLKKFTSKTKKALVVTQFIFTGETMMGLSDALQDAGVDDFDIAAVDAKHNFEEEIPLRSNLGANNLYIGSEEYHHLHEGHDKLGGVGKTKEYSPFPKRMADVIPKDGRDISTEEWREIFRIGERDDFKTTEQKTKDPELIKEFNRRMHAPLKPEEAEEIQRNINLAREDVALLAKRVADKTWGENPAPFDLANVN